MLRPKKGGPDPNGPIEPARPVASSQPDDAPRGPIRPEAAETGHQLPDRPNDSVAALAEVRGYLPAESSRTNEIGLRAELENRGQQILLKYLAGDDQPQMRSDFDMGLRLYLAAKSLAPTDNHIRARVL